MILYKNNLKGFRNDVDTNQIGELIEKSFREKLGQRANPNEKRSWNNPLSFMEKVVRRADLSDSCGVLLEYIIPNASNRIDFLISGENDKGNQNFVIIELKQWETAFSTDKDGIVRTYIGGGVKDKPHPSYQAHSYATFLKDFNESIYLGSISSFACAYLHNYKQLTPEPLNAEIYSSIIKEAPIYFKDDYEKLGKFLHEHVRFGKGEEILYKIESGKIRPSKKLIEHVEKMFNGNQTFTLLDDQKVAFETALSIALKATKKSVVLIKGGPGTGKSVISVNLLGRLLKEKMNVNFIAPNASFRDVIIRKLAQSERITRLHNLFKGSSSFVTTDNNIFDVLVVDEAHRLKKKGAYMYKGINQIEDIIKSAKVSIFFVDDNQMIRPDDIGSVSEIKKAASTAGAEIHEVELIAQFRCAGAEGYLNWLDNTLQIKETANFDGWEQKDFEFKIFDDPNKLREAIKEKHDNKFDARILAGFAWEWTSADKGNADGQVEDVTIPEFDFKMPWNSRRDGTTWAIEPNGIEQVGCIHTSQGLEFDYVGVIVGNDLRFNPDTLDYHAHWVSYKDVVGKRSLQNKPGELTKYVKNIYKVLMSRGMKGCYVYFVDKAMANYFRSRMRKN
jgi:DUF2075 family protein